jgi:hypothetical protein
LDVPPPLSPGYFDSEGALRWERGEGAASSQAVDQKCEKNDRGRGGSSRDGLRLTPMRVVVFWHRLGASTRSAQGKESRAENDEEDDGGDDEKKNPERIDSLGLWTSRVLNGLVGGTCSPRQQRQPNSRRG